MKEPSDDRTMKEPNHYLLPEAYENEYWKMTTRDHKIFEKRPKEECPNCSKFSISETIVFSRGFLIRLISEEKVQHTKSCDNCGYMMAEKTWTIDNWVRQKLNGRVNSSNEHISPNKVQTEIKE